MSWEKTYRTMKRKIKRQTLEIKEMNEDYEGESKKGSRGKKKMKAIDSKRMKERKLIKLKRKKKEEITKKWEEGKKRLRKK